VNQYKAGKISGNIKMKLKYFYKVEVRS